MTEHTVVENDAADAALREAYFIWLSPVRFNLAVAMSTNCEIYAQEEEELRHGIERILNICLFGPRASRMSETERLRVVAVVERTASNVVFNFAISAPRTSTLQTEPSSLIQRTLTQYLKRYVPSASVMIKPFNREWLRNILKRVTRTTQPHVRGISRDGFVDPSDVSIRR